MGDISNAEQYIAKIIFRNRIFEYQGQQFEDFFVKLMSAHNPNFKPVKAHGNIGDQKNDGFDKVNGKYYQVFSPEDITNSRTINYGVKKMETDFKKLFDHWNKICPIKEYFFVVNDKYNGIAAPYHELIIELKKNEKYKDVEINLLSANDLEKTFNSLDDSSKQDIVGLIPEEYFPVVEMEALQKTVIYLMGVETTVDNIGNLVVPDFGEKIIFNGLNPNIGTMLNNASFQEGHLSSYFKENPGVKELLQKKFSYLYEQSKIVISKTQKDFADLRFCWIVDEAAMNKTLPIITSVYVLMSYYFSSCDIFEEPTN